MLRFGVAAGIKYEPLWRDGDAQNNGMLAFLRPSLTGHFFKPWVRYAVARGARRRGAVPPRGARRGESLGCVPSSRRPTAHPRLAPHLSARRAHLLRGLRERRWLLLVRSSEGPHALRKRPRGQARLLGWTLRRLPAARANLQSAHLRRGGPRDREPDGAGQRQRAPLHARRQGAPAPRVRVAAGLPRQGSADGSQHRPDQQPPRSSADAAPSDDLHRGSGSLAPVGPVHPLRRILPALLGVDDRSGRGSPPRARGGSSSRTHGQTGLASAVASTGSIPAPSCRTIRSSRWRVRWPGSSEAPRSP